MEFHKWNSINWNSIKWNSKNRIPLNGTLSNRMELKEWNSNNGTLTMELQQWNSNNRTQLNGIEYRAYD